MSWISQKFHNVFRAGETAMHELNYLFWECTLRCNLHCGHCGSDCHAESSVADMPVEDFLRATKAYHHNEKPIFVAVTGGEPLMRRDLAECGAKLREAGFRWGIVSNGMAYEKRIHQQLVVAGIESVTLSLDGTEEQHNRLRGNSLSYARVMRALDLLIEDGRVVHDVVTCVNPDNLDSLEQVYENLLAHGCRNWRFFTIAPIGRAADEDAGLLLSGEQLCRLMNFIERVRAEGRINARFSCEAFVGPHERTVRDWHFFCHAGINIASILIDGSISACPNIDRRFIQGNIYKDDFQQVWEERFDVMRNRDWMRCGVCAECRRWADCQGGAMHLRTPESAIKKCLYHDMYGTK